MTAGDDAPESQPDRSAWHTMLRERDAEAHATAEAASVAAAVDQLEQRLARADAVNHALQEGIALRDRLLHAAYVTDGVGGDATLTRRSGLSRAVRRAVRALRSRAARSLERSR